MKNQKAGRYFAAFMIFNIMFEVISPSLALALTSGPSQAEFYGFEPANSSEMVDKFTGDFKYNIPLLDIDGYPINIAYHGGMHMESEASWVGLGWSLNPGVLNRQLNGLPDDFDGDVIANKTYYKPHYSVGVGFQISKLAAGSMNVSVKNTGIGITGILGGQATIGALLGYSNYNGHFAELQFEKSGHLGAGVSFLFWSPLAGGIAGGTGVRINSQDGVTKTNYKSYGKSFIDFNNSLSFSNFFTNTSLFPNYNIGQGTTYNSRVGKAYSMYFGSSGSESMLSQINPFVSNYTSGSSHVIPKGSMSFSPRSNNSFFGLSFNTGKKWGTYACVPIGIPFVTSKIEEGLFLGKHSYVSNSQIVDVDRNLPSYGYMNLENAGNFSLMDYNRFKDGTFMEDAPNTPFSTLTSDNFAAAAQGLAVNFSSKRSDLGIVHDPLSSNIAANPNVQIPVKLTTLNRFKLTSEFAGEDFKFMNCFGL
jgi:hypothetical protein